MKDWLDSLFSWFLTSLSPRALGEIAIAAFIVALVYIVPRRYTALSAAVTSYFRPTGGRVKFYVLAAMCLPLVFRLALLPVFPAPEPRYHDEFGHLLVADTLAAGRLANPPHPLWRHLETVYVLQHPAYASIYPIGQGAILAAGQVLTGRPWAGVLLSVMLMSGAIAWMLFGCLPPNWAAVGGLLAAVNYGLAETWVNSYWGGAFAAFGGALLFGALLRLRRVPSPLMGFVLGAGWSIVWLIRPYESMLLLIIVWGFLAASITRDRWSWRKWIGPLLLLVTIQFAAGCITAAHNRAVTGSVTTLPYRFSQLQYGVPQSFLWQEPVPEPELSIPELKAIYWWQRSAKDEASERPLRWWLHIVTSTWDFFVNPWLMLPVMCLVFALKDRQVGLGIVILAGAMTASAFYPFFFPHYIAAYTCIITFLIIRGSMALSHFSFRGRIIGPLIAVFLISGAFLWTLRVVPVKPLVSGHFDAVEPSLRGQVAGGLKRMGGQHVVFVRYGAHHNAHDGWIYNAANVDASPVVWCRAINPVEDAEVLKYYQDRHAWIALVDATSVRVSRYPSGLSMNYPEPRAQDWVIERKTPRPKTESWIPVKNDNGPDHPKRDPG